MFLQNTNVPQAYRDGAIVALHGSWNRSAKTGYKVIDFPWDPATQMPGDQIDLVSGWLQGGTNWGRPVDVAVAPDGGIYISDDQSGTIYKLMYSSAPPPPPASIASFTSSCTGFNCSFNGTGSTNATAWAWNFGDGSSGSGSTASHTYAKKGGYTVTLSTQPSGPQSSISKSIRCNPKGC
jgi:PKD repeat protein